MNVEAKKDSEDSYIAGTEVGGKAAAKKNEEREPGFYRRIGRLGGLKGKTGGFWANRELARIAGAKGGRISRRYKSSGTTG